MSRAREVKYKVTEIGCWEVTSHKASGSGYPMQYDFRKPGLHRPIRIYRLAWEVLNGPVPDGFMICHRCDNKLCINPDHLYMGTHRDNMNDVIARNKLKPKPAKPAKLPRKKLTDEQITYILGHMEINSTDMAKLMNVSLSNISLIRSGKRRSVAGFDYEAIVPISIERRGHSPHRPHRKETRLARLDRKIDRLIAELARLRVQRSLLQTTPTQEPQS